MKNETVPETLTLVQWNQQIKEHLGRASSMVELASSRHKKIELAQVVVEAAFVVSDCIEAGNPDKAFDAIKQMKMDIDLIQAQPIINPRKFISGGFISTKRFHIKKQ